MTSGFQLAETQARGYETHTRRFMDPSAKLLVDGVGLAPGDSVLDVACGTGLVARHALSIVGSSGWVVGADVNTAMLAVARGAAPTVEWVEAPAEQLPFDDETFDVVFCQQGVQFFSNAAAGCREAWRVLTAGGRFVATIWATPGGNPYIETQLAVLSRLDPTMAASVAGATPANADVLLASLAVDAGFDDAAVDLLEHQVLIGDPAEFFLAQSATTPWGSVLAGLSPPARREIADEFAALLAGLVPSSGVVPFASHRLVARRVGDYE